MSHKLGLALSGGGLRASFFHIGILAQMAERGLLRSVEVISAVSGGSIIAALYYLHLKKLLESKPDENITDTDYINLVQTIERDFFEAVKHNIRMLTFSDYKANWNMYREDYSRSDRIAELYDELLYRPVMKKATMVEMRELMIHPPGRLDFHPRKHNADRRAKVPVLVLNATTLNSGRNWHFTARTMGEPLQYDDKAQPIFDEIDSIPIRLRRPRPGYLNMVPRQQDFPLGAAVAASAGVPGLFPPLSVSGLYRDGDDPICVQLVDGGVHDNQGIDALLYEGCTRFVVSDASGQLDFEPCPETGSLAVLARSPSILQNRVRSESLKRLFETHGRNQVAFLHLRKGLGKQELSWVGPNGKTVWPPRIQAPSTKAFGVNPEVQEKLANIRTDLDAFTEVEACSLMLDGYLIGRQELKQLKPEDDETGETPTPWHFLTIGPKMADPDDDYLHQLEVAHFNVGKALLLIPWLMAATLAAALATLVLLWPTLSEWLNSSISIMAIVTLIGLFLLDWTGRRLVRLKGLRQLAPVVRYLKSMRKLLSGYQSGKRFLLRVALPLMGTLFVRAYLRFINPLLLQRGSLDKLQ